MRMLELFAGIGGISLAAHWAGIETVGFCEIDPFCQTVLKKHWPDVPIWPDVKELMGDEIRKKCGAVDIIAGGFPCQPYSVAGKRKGEEDDRALWPEMLRIISDVRPRWVVGENVAGFVNLGLDNALSDLENQGYSCQSFLIPACGIGAPHQRYRVFIMGYSEHNGPSSSEVAGGPEEASPNCTEGKNQASQPERAGQSCNSKNVADANVKRLPDGGQPEIQKSQAEAVWQMAQSEPERCGGSWWAIEPDVGRVANGVPGRVDRLRALGNAVVPQQIYPIFKAVMEIEKGARAS